MADAGVRPAMVSGLIGSPLRPLGLGRNPKNALAAYPGREEAST
jgi:hypothetical protein